MSAFIDERRGDFGVEPICRILDVSASAYYQRRTGERSDRQVEDERLLGVIGETHKDNYDAYGYRRCWKALTRAGETAPRCQVQRLMADHGIQGAKRRGKPWRTTIVDKTLRGVLISLGGTSPPTARMCCGWRISRICAAGRAGCASAS